MLMKFIPLVDFITEFYSSSLLYIIRILAYCRYVVVTLLRISSYVTYNANYAYILFFITFGNGWHILIYIPNFIVVQLTLQHVKS